MIGCGLISHAHGRGSLKSLKGIRFVACASRRDDVAKEWAESYGCEHYYTDYREMLRQEELNGVVIATWPSAHRAHIEAVLDADVGHILCEKALTTSTADALAIWNEAMRRGVTVIEGFMYRHHAAIIESARLVASGALGSIDTMHGTFHLFDPEDEPTGDSARTWRRRADAGGGVVHDFLCYPLDAANMFAGSLPVRVCATGSESKFGVTDRMFAHIDYANGCVATVASSRKSALLQSFQICGSEAILDIPFAWSAPGDVTLIKTSSPSFLAEEKVEYIIPQSERHGGKLIDFPVFRRQLENFAGVVRGSEAPKMPLASSIVNAIVLDAVNRSYRACAPVGIEIPECVVAAVEQA